MKIHRLLIVQCIMLSVFFNSKTTQEIVSLSPEMLFENNQHDEIFDEYKDDSVKTIVHDDEKHETQEDRKSEKKRTDGEQLDLELLAQAVDKLEKTIIRAPRPDAPTPASPSFPVDPFGSADLIIIRECLCEIKTLLTELIGASNVTPPPAGPGVCLPDIVTQAQINALNQTLNQWGQTILDDLRGVCSTEM